MRSPFSFISIKSRVVTLDMLTFQLGDLALPELALGQLGMGNRQVRLSHSLVSVTHDVEVEGPRPPPFAPSGPGGAGAFLNQFVLPRAPPRAAGVPAPRAGVPAGAGQGTSERSGRSSIHNQQR